MGAQGRKKLSVKHVGIVRASLTEKVKLVRFYYEREMRGGTFKGQKTKSAKGVGYEGARSA